MNEEIDVKIENEYIGRNVILSKHNQHLIILTIALAISLLLSLIICFFVAIKKEMVVGIDKMGLAVPLEVQKESIANLIDYKIFITTFLTRIFEWNSQTYINQIKLALPLMAEDIRSEFLQKIKDSQLLKDIEENRIVSTIQLQPIPNELIKFKDGYQVEIDAIKIRITDYSVDRTEAVKLVVGFRKCRLTKDNFYGLEVFYLSEYPISDPVKGGRP